MFEVKASDYIQSGFSAEDAGKIAPIIKNALKEHGAIKVNFKGISYYTTLFFSQSVTNLLGQMSKKEYDSKIKIANLTKSGKITYQHAMAYAVDFYSETEQERIKQEEMVNKTLKNI